MDRDLVPAPGMSGKYSLAVICTPGLEFVTRGEVDRIGGAVDWRRGGSGSSPGLVECTAPLKKLYELNLRLRTASRVLVRLGSFHAAAFPELRKKAAELPWASFLRPGEPVTFRVTATDSKLYHKRGIAERMAGAVADALGREPEPPREGEEGQLVVVRIARDKCAVSIDSSGDHLHRRGYRLQAGKAPIREHLAAAVILASGWDGRQPLVDPFCGSGTIPIEAAMIAANIAPGLNRTFAFRRWPGYDAALWDAVAAAARAEIRTAELPPISGSDRDAGAVSASQANAERAGAGGMIAWSRKSISEFSAAGPAGWVVTNPPYDIRVTGGADMRNLYARMGSVWSELPAMWHIYLLSASPRLTGQLGFASSEVARFSNGGVPVALIRREERNG